MCVRACVCVCVCSHCACKSAHPCPLQTTRCNKSMLSPASICSCVRVCVLSRMPNVHQSHGQTCSRATKLHSKYSHILVVSSIGVSSCALSHARKNTYIRLHTQIHTTGLPHIQKSCIHNTVPELSNQAHAFCYTHTHTNTHTHTHKTGGYGWAHTPSGRLLQHHIWQS
jgi:hypothetical protein